MPMARTLFFRMVLRKYSEIINNKPNFTQYNIFYNFEYFFFQSAFWSLFNHHQGSQSNQKQCSLCCGLSSFRVLLCTHYGPLQCFSTYFRKLKEIGVLRPKFPDYVFSCDYDETEPLNAMNVATALEGKIVLFIGSAKIPEREGSTSPSSFYGQLPDY